MNIEKLKSNFISYLEEQGKFQEKEEQNELSAYEDISIFSYASEFKSFLESEYDASDIVGKSISDILKMDITANGKLVEAEDETVEDQESTDDTDNINKKKVISKVEAKLENEISDDMSNYAAAQIVDDFENQITNSVNENILMENIEELTERDLFKDVFNELIEDDKFKQAIDTDSSNDISQKELENFLNSIKTLDDNEDDVSVNDLLTAATQINEGKFTFVSKADNTNNHSKIHNTPVQNVSDNIKTPEHTSTFNNPMDAGLGVTTSAVQTQTPSCGTNTNVGSTSQCGNVDSSNLDSMTSELEGLQQEKSETETDLSNQTETLNQTQDEKEQVVGGLCQDIEAGNQDLSTAQDDVSTKACEQEAAQTDLTNAQQQTQCSKNEADNAANDLTNAQNATDKAQTVSDTAADNNEQAIQTETEAQDDSTAANDDLTTAVGNTDAAQGVADTKGQELTVAATEASEAFSVLNVKNKEVEKAQAEYNNAKAQQKDKNIFQKIASWVSSLFNKLSDAIAGRDHAKAEAERKAAEEEKAQVASDKALDALEDRKEEQEEAQTVADAAQVVLERATGEREVSDQEYAEALIALASAMETEENAESEYNTAFDNYLQMNNYQIDAEGRLQDANGNYISATQVAEELETYVQGLVEARDTKETEYDDVIVATTEVISGDESKISELDTKITDLQAQIEQEKENIALQEAMITELSTQQSEINAANSEGGLADGIASLFGFGTAADQKGLDSQKALLEEALLTGDSEKIAEAYKAIYGDNEVIVDASGNIVDPSTLSEEELAECSVANVSELSAENVAAIMHKDAAAIANAAQTMDIINEGFIVCGDEEVSLETINAILEEQFAEMAQDMDNAVSRQGGISKLAGGINNFLGIGTSENEARAQVELYQELVAQLNSCTDPVEYAALFKQITGRDFSMEAVVELLAYDKVSKGESTETEDDTAAPIEGKVDISEYVNSVVDVVNEDENLSKDSLSLTKDNTAREAIEDYKETQETAKDAVIGVVSGVASTVVVTLCSAAGVCAAPFTGGASLSLIAAGFGIAGGTGAAVSAGLNAFDSIYDADGDGSLDFNYSWKEFGKDALIGGLNGIVGNFANGVGAAVTGRISTQATQTAVTTTLKETVKKGAVNFGGKVAGAAVEGFIDGGFSASGEYAINALFDENVDFSFEQFVETGLQGGAIGSVFNVGMTAVSSGVSAIAGEVKAKGFASDVNQFLSEGTTNNQLAELVAGKLDDSLLDADGMINQYAANQLMKNAETALGSLESYFKSIDLDPSDAIKALDNISLADMPNVPSMLSALRQLDLPGIDMTTAEGISDGLSKIDDIELNPNGTLSSMKVVSDGQEITFDFDSNGKLSAVGLAGGSNDLDIDLDVDDVDIHVDGDDIKIDGDDIKVDGDDIKIDGDDIKIDGNDTTTNLADKYADTPISKEEAIETINKLVDMGKLPDDINYSQILNDPTSINKDFYNDLNKLYKAYSEGIDVQKVFVPEFSNIDDAIKSIKVGDVCTLDGGNTIGIKLADGTLQQINMSAETFMELFPPAQRFATMQGNVGDCFLVSSLDLMFKTPETRVKLLECFTEQADGSIIVNLGGQSIHFNNIKEIDEIINKYSLIFGKNTNVDGAAGFKMLETLVGVNYIDVQSQRLMNILNNMDPSSPNYQKYFNELMDLQNASDLVQMSILARANGGRMEEVFKIFGLDNVQAFSSPDAIRNILSNQENWDKLIITLGSKPGSDTTFINQALNIAYGHAYGVEPYLLNGQMMFKITNPWDGAVHLNLTLDEILQYFNYMAIASK